MPRWTDIPAYCSTKAPLCEGNKNHESERTKRRHSQSQLPIRITTHHARTQSGDGQHGRPSQAPNPHRSSPWQTPPLHLRCHCAPTILPLDHPSLLHVTRRHARQKLRINSGGGGAVATATSICAGWRRGPRPLPPAPRPHSSPPHPSTLYAPTPPPRAPHAPQPESSRGSRPTERSFGDAVSGLPLLHLDSCDRAFPATRLVRYVLWVHLACPPL